MATEIPIVTQSFIAGADLSAKQGYFVKLSGSTRRTVVVCSANTDIPVGVLLNSPASGEMATVGSLGQFKISGDANLACNDRIGTSADGQAAAYVAGTDTPKYIVGYVLDENTTAGGLISAWINCISPARGA